MNYLTLDLLILAFPLALSFKWFFPFYKLWPPLFASTAVVATAYISWDAVATSRGHWWFDHHYVGESELLGLPLEEVLFFIVVPYACIFIYENLEHFLKEDRGLPFDRRVYMVAGIAFLLAALAVYPREYTMLALLSCGVFFVFAASVFPKVLGSRNYWLYIALSFVPFVIFNYILTSTVIVHYGPDFVSGYRVLTIPLEDFFYNFALLSFYLTVYLAFKERLHRPGGLKKKQGE